MKVVGWRVWVDGEGIYDSHNNTWDSVPSDGIIEMVTYKEGGYREMFSGHDHYFHAPHSKGTIYGCNNDSMDEIKRRYPGAVIKKGKWIPSEEMAKIQKDIAINYRWPE